MSASTAGQNNSQQALQWYIIKTKSNCEFKVQQAIRNLIQDRKLDSQIEQILIPEKEIIQVVKGKKVTRSRKFYPGYIFVQMRLTDSLWHLIKTATNVINFVGHQGVPTKVPDEQIKGIYQQIKEDLARPSSQVFFSIGEHVNIIDGPFKTFTGTVEEVNQEKERVKVSVSIFGRPTPVELDFAQVYREE